MVVAHSNGRRRHQHRLDHMLGLVQPYRPAATNDDIKAGIRAAVQRYETQWKQKHVTPSTSELVTCIWQELDLSVEEDEHAETVRIFEEGLLEGPPDFAEGLEEVLEWAADRYRLGVISDTMFSPGRVIRQLLDQRGVLGHFDTFVFSDETGFAKPDVRAFEQAHTAFQVAPHEVAHIGDLRRTDVAGAQKAGLTAVLFTGVHNDEEDVPAPDAVLTHWQDLPGLLAKLSR